MPFFGRISDGDTDTFIPDGSIANKELTNCTVSYGGISLSLGGVCATPQFNLTNAENYNAGSLSGGTLNSGVTASSLTSVGTLTSLNVAGNVAVGAGTTIFSNGTATFGGSVTAPSFSGSFSGTATNADTLDGQEGSYYQNATNLNAGTVNTARLPNTYTKAATVTIQSTGAANDVIIDAADHIILESGEEEDGNIYFRGNGGSDSYRFAKSGQTAIEGFLSFESLTADRTFTFPDVTGTIALTSSTVANATNAGDADTLDGQQGSFYQNASNINAGTLAAARLPSTMNATTFTGDLRVDNDADLRIGDGAANERILIQKADNNVSDHIIFYNGTTRIGEIGCEDTTWLRINQETAKNIYTPRYIRADAGFFVDGTTKGINGSGNFIGGTIAGASDYGTLLRSDADDTATGTVTFNGLVNIRGNIDLADNDILRLGSGDDAELFCDGSHLYLDLNSGIGNFYIRDGTTTRFTFDDSGAFTSTGTVSASGFRIDTLTTLP